MPNIFVHVPVTKDDLHLFIVPTANIEEDSAVETSPGEAVTSKRGRPKGSKNKVKEEETVINTSTDEPEEEVEEETEEEEEVEEVEEGNEEEAEEEETEEEENTPPPAKTASKSAPAKPAAKSAPAKTAPAKPASAKPTTDAPTTAGDAPVVFDRTLKDHRDLFGALVTQVRKDKGEWTKDQKLIEKAKQFLDSIHKKRRCVLAKEGKLTDDIVAEVKKAFK